MPQGKQERTFALSTILVALVSTLAILLNGLLIFLLSRTKRKDTLSIKFIKLLSALDFLTGIFRVNSFLIRVCLGIDEVLKLSWYCQIFGIATFCIPSLSLIFISALAFERFLILCHSKEATSNYTSLTVVIFCIAVIIPNLMVLIKDTYLPGSTRFYCIPLKTIESKISKDLFMILVLASYTLTTFCYLNIIFKHPTSSSLSSTRRIIWIRSLILIFTYSVCFIPIVIGIGIVGDVFFDIHNIPVAKSIIPVCVAGITAIDPILVLVLYRPLSKELLLLFRVNEKVGSTVELHPIDLNEP